MLKPMDFSNPLRIGIFIKVPRPHFHAAKKKTNFIIIHKFFFKKVTRVVAWKPRGHKDTFYNTDLLYVYILGCLHSRFSVLTLQKQLFTFTHNPLR